MFLYSYNIFSFGTTLITPHFFSPNCFKVKIDLDFPSLTWNPSSSSFSPLVTSHILSTTTSTDFTNHTEQTNTTIALALFHYPLPLYSETKTTVLLSSTTLKTPYYAIFRHHPQFLLSFVKLHYFLLPLPFLSFF